MIRAVCERGAIHARQRVTALSSRLVALPSILPRRYRMFGMAPRTSTGVRTGATTTTTSSSQRIYLNKSNHKDHFSYPHGDANGGGPFVLFSAAMSVAFLGTALTLCEASPPSTATTTTDNHHFHASEEPKNRLSGIPKGEQSHIETRSTELKAGTHAEKQQQKDSAPEKQQEKKSSTSSRVQATSPSVDENMTDNIMGKMVFAQEMTESEARLEESARKAKQHSGGIKIFSGNGNMSLAMEITRHLGITLGKATVGRFADGEANVVIKENVRGKDVYVVQPTCPPVNDNLMELLLMVSTLRRASARRITVVIPYYGYARQDRKMQARVPISAADVARLMEAIGVDRVIAVDLHCGQIQGFFGPRVPVDNLDGGVVGLDYFGSKDLNKPVIVSPDAGGVYRAKKFKEGLEQKYDITDLGLAMIVKQRARAGSVDQMDLVGDVNGCDCIIVDDMIDTAGTLCKAAEVLKAKGAARVFAFASHGLLSGPGNERIAASQMEEVVILNTIPTSPQREANEKLTELSVADLLARAIFNIHAKKSVSALFK